MICIVKRIGGWPVAATLYKFDEIVDLPDGVASDGIKQGHLVVATADNPEMTEEDAKRVTEWTEEQKKLAAVNKKKETEDKRAGADEESARKAMQADAEREAKARQARIGAILGGKKPIESISDTATEKPATA